MAIITSAGLLIFRYESGGTKYHYKWVKKYLVTPLIEMPVRGYRVLDRP